MEEKIRVLFFASNPEDETPLNLDEEIRSITTKIRASEHRDVLDLISRWAVRPDDLLQELNTHRPTVVHFSGHGSSSGELILMNDQRQAKTVSPTALRMLFSTLKDNIRLVLLNACYSQIQAEAIAEVIDCVIGMNTSIGDDAAIAFAASFYRAIGFGRSVKNAFEQGMSSLMLEAIPEEDIPVLLVRSGVDAASVHIVNSKRETAAVYATQPAVSPKGDIRVEINYYVKDGVLIAESNPLTEETLASIRAIPTGIQTNGPGAVPDNKIPKTIDATHKGIDLLLGQISAAKGKGKEIEAVQLGDEEISPIDLLLKKAILLETEASRMMFDNINRKQAKLDEINRRAKSEIESEQDFIKWQKNFRKVLMKDFDERAYMGKLQEARTFLEEAYRLDDENPEVLLHMANLLITLTPDDPTDEQHLLYRVQALLHKPKNDADRLRVAQATYLIAASFLTVLMTKPPGPNMNGAANALKNMIPALHEARNSFAELGEMQWMQKSEELLTSLQEQPLVRQGDFEIVGRWGVVISLGDINQGTMNIEFARDSSFQGMLLPSGQSVQGRWAFVPMQRTLHLQGYISGFQHFAVDVTFQHVQKDGAMGKGSDGFSYALIKPRL